MIQPLRPSRQRRPHASLTSCLAALALATASHAQHPVGPAPAVVDVGTHRWGAVLKGSVAAENPRRADKRKECKGEHDFRILLDADAAKFIELPEDPTIYRVALGERKRLPAVIDTNRLPRPADGSVGIYEGIVTSLCLTCAGKCALERQTYRFSLIVLAPDGGEPAVRDPGEAGGGGGGGGGAGPSGGGGGGELPGGSDPRDADETAPRCGPDVSKALAALLWRVSGRLQLPEFVAADAFGSDAGPTFKAGNAERPIAVSPAGSCPRPPAECGGTVTLFGTCVPETMLATILDGLLDESLRIPHPIADPRLRDPRLADSLQERRYLSGYSIGRGLGMRHLVDHPTDPDFDATLAEAWNDVVATDEALTAAYRKCQPCTQPAGFSADWSLLVWNRNDGSLLRPPAPPGEKR